MAIGTRRGIAGESETWWPSILWPSIAIAVLLAGVAGIVLYLLSIGSMTAALGAVIAGCLTAVVTVMGLVLQRQASWRAQMATDDANRRLRLEAAVKAASILTPTGGVAPDQASIGAALLALCDLGQAELAVALLGDTWHPPGAESDREHVFLAAPQSRTAAPASGKTADSKVSNATAILVIDKALSTESGQNAQVMAAEILCRRATALSSTSAVEWPGSLDGQWLPELPYIAKLYIMDGLITMTITHDADDLALSVVAARLYGVYDSEKGRGDAAIRVRRCASRMLDAVLPTLLARHWQRIMGRRRDAISIATLERAAHYAAEVDADTSTPVPGDLLEKLETDRFEKLRSWARGCTGAAIVEHRLASAG